MRPRRAKANATDSTKKATSQFTCQPKTDTSSSAVADGDRGEGALLRKRGLGGVEELVPESGREPLGRPPPHLRPRPARSSSTPGRPGAASARSRPTPGRASARPARARWGSRRAGVSTATPGGASRLAAGRRRRVLLQASLDDEVLARPEPAVAVVELELGDHEHERHDHPEHGHERLARGSLRLWRRISPCARRIAGRSSLEEADLEEAGVDLALHRLEPRLVRGPLEDEQHADGGDERHHQQAHDGRQGAERQQESVEERPQQRR